MNATRRIKSVILRNGGLKKVLVIRLSALHICMSYDATSRMFESYGEDFDVPIKLWKQEVESGVRKEKELMASILKLERENLDQDVVKSAVKELEEHRAQMHPGYSFTGDNVDKRVLPRQMTIKNKAKDHHMFQTVAFTVRIELAQITYLMTNPSGTLIKSHLQHSFQVQRSSCSLLKN